MAIKLKPYIIGREKELHLLESAYKSTRSKLIVVYGRRRIGKTYLLNYFGKNKSYLYFDGIEKEQTPAQLQHVAGQLYQQTNNNLLRGLSPNNWREFFTTLLEVLPKNKKTVIVFDEVQWLACGRSAFVSLLKSYWDNYFMNKNVVMILCGSVAHYMVKKVIRSVALYGRIDNELLVRELSPEDARKMTSRRGLLESLNYQLIMGGVPKYLDQIDESTALDSNITKLFFQKNSFFHNEVDKVFFSQFKEADKYKKIISELSKSNLSLEEISKKLNLKSGGSMKGYLENLEMADFIKSYKPFAINKTKEIKYKLVDNYLRFYFQYIKPYEKSIAEEKAKDIYLEQIKPNWKSWLGLSFETFIFKNSLWLADKLGFAGKVKDFGPYLINTKNQKTQIDLIFFRSDNVVTLVEVKMHSNKIGVGVALEIEKKVSALEQHEKMVQGKTIEKVLVTAGEVDKVLKDSEYFHRIVGLRDLLENR